MFTLDEETRNEEERMLSQYLLEQCYIDPEEELSRPPVAISMGEYTLKTKEGVEQVPIPLGTYGNFSLICAEPKRKKTFLVTLLSASYLGGKTSYSSTMRGHSQGRCLLHFDTEQSDYHAQRVFKRPLRMCDKINQCYMTYGLRQLNHKDRIKAIEAGIQKYSDNLGLVIIDGLADLCSDVNNIEESNEVVQKVMTWSKEYNCHIITVVHTTFGSSKPTGHLGSAMEKKCETAMFLDKAKKNEEMINVTCRASRGYPFRPFSFYVNDYGLPQIADEFLGDELMDFIGQ